MEETEIERLANRYFDEFIVPHDREAGIPEYATEQHRIRYIQDVKNSPEAIEQLKEMYA